MRSTVRPYEVTPYSPTMASTNASSPNAATAKAPTRTGKKPSPAPERLRHGLDVIEWQIGLERPDRSLGSRYQRIRRYRSADLEHAKRRVPLGNGHVDVGLRILEEELVTFPQNRHTNKCRGSSSTPHSGAR